MPEGAEPPRARSGPRGSIKTPIVGAIVLANVVVFLLLLWTFQSAVKRDAEDIGRDYSLQLQTHLSEVVDIFGRIRAQKILDWRGWRRFDDVLVVQAPRRDATDKWRVDGVYLNPLGSQARRASFDEQNLLGKVAAAMETGEPITDGAQRVLPFGRRPDGRPWGGVVVWDRPVTFASSASDQLLPIFGVLLLVIALGFLVLLRRLVLEPVRRLAGAAQRLEAGDMSARVELAGERRDELGLLGDRFNEMAARMERYNAELEEAVDEATERVRTAEAAAMTQRRLAATGELAAGIAHELNNPLGGLINAVEALKRPDLKDERRREYLELVSGGLARMGETVGRLLRLSPREAALSDVPLGRPLLDALGLVRHRAEGAGVELVLRREGGEISAVGPDARPLLEALPQVRGSTNELGQAFLNLFVNAVDAIEGARVDRVPAGGPGRIVLDIGGALGAASGEPLRLVFTDDGPGIDDELLARVADPFFTTKEQGKGTGLGLAIVHNIVAAHGGRVLLEGRPGTGLRVTIELPRPGAVLEAGSGL